MRMEEQAGDDKENDEASSSSSSLGPLSSLQGPFCKGPFISLQGPSVLYGGLEGPFNKSLSGLLQVIKITKINKINMGLGT